MSENNRKINAGIYIVATLFLSGLSWWLLPIGGGIKSVLAVVSTYLFCLWTDS